MLSRDKYGHVRFEQNENISSRATSLYLASIYRRLNLALRELYGTCYFHVHMALDETIVDEFASAIRTVLDRHAITGRLRDLLIGELTNAVVGVLEPLEFRPGCRLFDGINEAMPKKPHGPAS